MEVRHFPESSDYGTARLTALKLLPHYELEACPKAFGTAEDRWGDPVRPDSTVPTAPTPSFRKTAQSFLVPAKKLIPKVQSQDGKFSDPALALVFNIL
jgi:hypothetical protein